MWFRCPGFLHHFTQKLKKQKKLRESLENLIPKQHNRDCYYFCCLLGVDSNDNGIKQENTMTHAIYFELGEMLIIFCL